MGVGTACGSGRLNFNHLLPQVVLTSLHEELFQLIRSR